jgi:DNA repair exonuclease SbcCD nuclease subunit
MITLIGDVHIKKDPDSPYNKGLQKLFDYIFATYPDHTLMFSGDLLDEQLIHNSVRALFGWYFRNHLKDIYVVTGNHELPRYAELGNTLDFLKVTGNTHVIHEAWDTKVDGLDFRFLPYLPRLSQMRAYSEITDPVDVSLGHFAYPGTNRNQPDEIPINFKAKIVHALGHIHEPQTIRDEYGIHEIIGVPAPTRNGEQFHQPRVLVIDPKKKTYHSEDLPRLFTIETIEYGKEPEDIDNIINVISAPSTQMVRERYAGYNLREDGIQLLVDEKQTTESLKEDTERTIKGNDLTETFVVWPYLQEEEIPEEVVTTCVDFLTMARDMGSGDEE